jgi:hypothetical protein
MEKTGSVPIFLVSFFVSLRLGEKLKKLSQFFSGEAILLLILLLTPSSLNLKLFSPGTKGDLLMADKTIVFSDQEQMQIESIVIDKDGEEALRYLAALLDRIKPHLGHACGPKAAEGPPGQG